MSQTHRSSREHESQGSQHTSQDSSEAHANTVSSTCTDSSLDASTTASAPSGGDDHKGARRGAIFIGATLLIFVVYLVATGQVAQFVDALSNVQVLWLTVACLCMLMYLIFGIAAYAIAVWLDPNSPVGIRDLISVEASGIFFGNLTPMMVGSTPAQIYRLTKAGQNVGEAGATQFTRFIVYQFGLVVWGGLLLALRMPFFLERYPDVGALTILCIFSFGGHVLILLLIFAIALMPKTVTRVSHWGISCLARLGLAQQKIEHWRGFVDNEVYSFSENFKYAAKHASSMALTVVITMLQLGFFYLVPYYLMLAFGHHDVDFLSVMAASAFIHLLSSAVPLPGGTGGAEGGFALFLGHFYGSAATAGYLLWRLITFIVPTIVAAPLLGLKSAHKVSIRERWERFRA
ncbi:lysylphosphatidylglycerol synthase transmembrane domain-containing protein [Collinsella sp. zg1085]|uniref:lysylphosphatidylglycerol synthase transmembrane domain-containing protein n=1 Tax=Collinsella sp. zg1085 TaxID=2844380 RepID=UPI00209B6D13|nr:lysylphosphatidylglycerol synthase transmembrane domain-containing protein [Collinsella sp. zg1085]